MFNKLLVSVLFVSIVLFAGTARVHAQATPNWVKGYPQAAANGCVDYVAQWSDNTWTSVPWTCPAGVIPVRPGTNATAVSSFPQMNGANCTEYVVIWSDQGTTWVPFECPPGMFYPKPVWLVPEAQGPIPVDPGIGEPVNPGQPVLPVPVVPGMPGQPVQPAPVDPNLPFRSTGLLYERNCGFTLLKIKVVDVSGNPLNGVIAKIEWDGMQPGQNPIVTNPTGRPGSYEPGWTDASLSGRGIISGVWRVWIVDPTGANRLSDVVGFVTNNDCETADGKQIVTVTFQANPGR